MDFRPRLRAPSPALVIAVIALFVSVGGAAYAVTLAKNEVKSRNIAPKAVTGSDIASNAVKPSKIKSDAVDASKLADGAVGEGAIAEGAVTRTKIKAQAVTTPKIADGAVEAAKLGDGEVTAAKLGANSVTSASVLTAFSQTIDLPNLTMGTCTRQPVPVPSVQAGDSVIVTPPDLNSGIVFSADAVAGEIGLRYCPVDFDGDPAAASFRFLVIR